MKTGIIIGAVLIGAVAIVGVTKYIGAKALGNETEQRIHALYEDNQQQFAQFGQKVAEAVGVAQLQADDAAALYSTVLESRYGDQGLQAQIAMISEAMPGLDASVYTKIQQISEAGRNDFAFAQKQLIDTKRTYRTLIGSPIDGMFLSWANYPQINIGYPIGTQDDYPAITSAMD